MAADAGYLSEKIAMGTVRRIWYAGRLTRLTILMLMMSLGTVVAGFTLVYFVGHPRRVDRSHGRVG